MCAYQQAYNPQNELFIVPGPDVQCVCACVSVCLCVVYSSQYMGIAHKNLQDVVTFRTMYVCRYE